MQSSFRERRSMRWQRSLGDKLHIEPHSSILRLIEEAGGASPDSPYLLSLGFVSAMAGIPSCVSER